MPKQICLASWVKNTKKGKIFSIIERVPIRLPTHDAIWAALEAVCESALVIDERHPEEGFPAQVVKLDVLRNGADSDFQIAIADARKVALQLESRSKPSGALDKSLDKVYDMQREWLALRALLVGAGLRPLDGSQRKRINKSLVLLLIAS